MDVVVLSIVTDDENEVTVWSSEKEAQYAALEYLTELLTNDELDHIDGFSDMVSFCAESGYANTQISFHLLPTKEQ